MAIKDLYKEAVANKVKGPKMAPEMTEKEFVTEHKRLVKVLKSGNRAELDKELAIQQEELDEVLGTTEEKGEPADADDTD